MTKSAGEHGGGAGRGGRESSPEEGVQSYVPPAGGKTGQEKAPSSMGEPEPEHVEASLRGKAGEGRPNDGGARIDVPASPAEGVTPEQMEQSGRED